MTIAESSLHYSGNRLAFGRGQDNPIGLKLAFTWDGRTARAEFTPTEYHQGWPGVVHGGITLALLDEAAGSAVSFAGLNCVSARIQVKLKHPAMVGVPLIVSASVKEIRRSVVITDTYVCDRDGKEIAAGEITLMVIRPEYLKPPAKPES